MQKIPGYLSLDDLEERGELDRLQVWAESHDG